MGTLVARTRGDQTAVPLVPACGWEEQSRGEGHTLAAEAVEPKDLFRKEPSSDPGCAVGGPPGPGAYIPRRCTRCLKSLPGFAGIHVSPYTWLNFASCVPPTASLTGFVFPSAAEGSGQQALWTASCKESHLKCRVWLHKEPEAQETSHPLLTRVDGHRQKFCQQDHRREYLRGWSEQ